MSHVDSYTVSSVLAEIDVEYGKISKTTIMLGKIHKYLGITIDYSFSGKVILFMVDCIGNMIGII